MGDLVQLLSELVLSLDGLLEGGVRMLLGLCGRSLLLLSLADLLDGVLDALLFSLLLCKNRSVSTKPSMRTTLAHLCGAASPAERLGLKIRAIP